MRMVADYRSTRVVPLGRSRSACALAAINTAYIMSGLGELLRNSRLTSHSLSFS
jgi:hypothetical protein